MSHLLPLVEELADCTGDAARADWLLRVSDGVVMRDFDSIRVILQKAQFRAGVAFLRLRYSVLHATRNACGELPVPIAAEILRHRRDMIAVARGATAGEGETG